MLGKKNRSNHNVTINTISAFKHHRARDGWIIAKLFLAFSWTEIPCVEALC